MNNMTEPKLQEGFDRSRYTVLKNRPGVTRAIAHVIAAEHSGQLLGALKDDSALVASLRAMLSWLKSNREADKRYFVLRYDCPDGKPADPCARQALATYADDVAATNMTFANELHEELHDTDPPETPVDVPGLVDTEKTYKPYANDPDYRRRDEPPGTDA